MLGMLLAAAVSMTSKADVDAVLKPLRGQTAQVVVAELGPASRGFQWRGELVLQWVSKETIDVTIRSPNGHRVDNPTTDNSRTIPIAACSLRATFSSAGALKSWRWKGSTKSCNDLAAQIAAKRAAQAAVVPAR